MKKLVKILFISFILITISCISTSANSEYKGYSEWSTTKTDDPNEISAIQYGVLLPKTWSTWSTSKADTLYQKMRLNETKHYTNNGNPISWKNANAKTLYTWNFGGLKHVSGFFGDVDTYVGGSWTNYDGPPLELKCDGKTVASVGRHDYLKNWEVKLDCNCSMVELSMRTNNGDGRNNTMVVGTWLLTSNYEYSYVKEWNTGSGWRFNEPYEDKYGAESQIPTSRTVYSYPIEYKINYDLDGGEFKEEPTYTYTVLSDDIKIPSAKKLGYEFLGFYDESGNKIEVIKKGSTGNLNLKAKYERKDPTLYVGYTYFDVSDTPLSFKDLIKEVKATASDELDGDLTKNIYIEDIEYEIGGNNTYLDLSKEQSFTITFSVKNSGDKKVSVKRTYYILGTATSGEKEVDVDIYFRYINEDFNYTLTNDSIWATDENYKQKLIKAYKKMEE